MASRTEGIQIEYTGESAGAVNAARAVNASLDSVEKKASGIGNAFSNLGGIISGALSVAGGFAITRGIDALGGFLGDALQEARDNAEGQAALAQALANTAAQTGVTGEMVNDLAGEMQLLTRFTDDEILAAGTVLGRFKEIGQDIFPDTTKAALDLASVLKIDTASAAKLLGKALAEPGAGLARLRAAGVVFTDEQEKVIKSLFETGRAAEAQTMILEHLNSTIGGTAEAMGATAEGQAIIFSHMVDDIKQSVGDILLPFLNQAMGKAIELFRSPAVQEGIKSFIDVISKGIKGLITFFEKVAMPFFKAMIDGIVDIMNDPLLQAAFLHLSDLVARIGNTLFTLFNMLQQGDWQGAIGRIVSDIGGAFGLLPADIQGATDAVGGAVQGIKDKFAEFQAWITTGAGGQAFSGIKKTIDEEVIPAYKRFEQGVNDHILGPIEEILRTEIDKGLAESAKQLGEFGGILGGELNKGIEESKNQIEWFTGTFIPELEKIGGKINTAVAGWFNDPNVQSNIEKAKEIWDGLPQYFADLGGRINKDVDEFKTAFATAWGQIFTAENLKKVEDFVKGVPVFFANLGGEINTKIDELKAGFTAKWNEIFSPETLKKVQDFVDAIPQYFADLGGQLNAKVNQAKEAFQTKWDEMFSPADTKKVQDFVLGIPTFFADLGGKINTKLDEVKTAFQTKWNEIFTAENAKKAEDFIKGIPQFFADLGGQINTKLGEVQAAFEPFRAWLKNDLGPALGELGLVFTRDVMPVLLRLKGFFDEHVTPALLGLEKNLNEHANPALTELARVFNEGILPKVNDFVALLGPGFTLVMTQLGDNIVTMIRSLASLISWIFRDGIPGLEKFAGAINEKVNDAIETMRDIWQTITDNFEKALGFVRDTTGALGDLANALNGHVGAAFTTFKNVILDPLVKLWDGLVAAAQAFLDLLGKIAEALPSIRLPDFGGGGGGGAAGPSINPGAGGVLDNLGGSRASSGSSNPFTGERGANGRNFNNYGSITVVASDVNTMLDEIETRLGARVQRERRNLQ